MSAFTKTAYYKSNGGHRCISCTRACYPALPHSGTDEHGVSMFAPVKRITFEHEPEGTIQCDTCRKVIVKLVEPVVH